MNSIFTDRSYLAPVIRQLETFSWTQKIIEFAKGYFDTEKTDETSLYEDKLASGKLVSSTKLHYQYPFSSHKNTLCHTSFEAMCLHIAKMRDSKAKKSLPSDASRASFSALNRADLVTESKLSKGLKKLLGLENKSDQEINKILETKSLYKHNSDFNGHSYFDKDGKLIQIKSAIASSADRKTDKAQNLSAVKSGGKNLLYTGRPDTVERAKEQALFMLSHKQGVPMLQEATSVDTSSEKEPSWIKQAKGLTWNPQTKCVEFPYAIYSLMSDSDMLNAYRTVDGSWADNEKLFIKKERKTLEKLKSSPILVKDSQGNVFRLKLKPIFLSQGFNAFSTIKGLTGEGSLSPILMKRAWDEIKVLLKANPEKAKEVDASIAILTRYFKGLTYLSSLHLFLHVTNVLTALSGPNEELPLVLHCKSSTDRTGIGAAILATMRQLKTLNIKSTDMTSLTKDPRFKELFALNWLPTWHQRSRYSRDVAGISFGSGLLQNPILIDCLPKRYLKESDSISRWIGSGLFAGLNGVGLWIYQTLKMELPCSIDVVFGDLLLHPKDWLALLRHNYLQYQAPSYYPKTFINEKGNAFRSKGTALSPLEKMKLGN